MRLADPIVHQQQPTPCSCTPTCVAMALGIPVAELGVDLARGWGQYHFGVWLAERGIWLRVCERKERMCDGHVYIATVPSLNTIAGMHCVLVDTRAPKKANGDSGWLTFDPCKGVDGKNHYDWVDHHRSDEFYELAQRLGGGLIAGSAP